MPYTGSGVYVLPVTSVTPAVGSTTISSADFNSFTADLATALTLCLTEDGNNVPTANLPMATFRHTGVSDGAALTDYASVNQVVDNALCYGGASAVGTDAYAVNLSVNPVAYVAGNRYQFIADVANTGACTINFNSIGAKSIKIQDGNDPADNYIIADAVVDVEYDGTDMVLMGVPSIGVNTASAQTMTNKTLTSPVINTGVSGTAIDTDGTLAADSDTLLASQKAVKTYVDNVQGGKVLETPVATTSGTSVDFTSIPAWAKSITVIFDQVGNGGGGGSDIIIQIGDAGGIETASYVSGMYDDVGTYAANTDGFAINRVGGSGANTGSITLNLINASTFTWIASGVIVDTTTTDSALTSGSKSLSAALDRIRITTEGGTVAFANGQVNISYE